MARTGRRQAGIRHDHGPDGAHERAFDGLHLLEPSASTAVADRGCSVRKRSRAASRTDNNVRRSSADAVRCGLWSSVACRRSLRGRRGGPSEVSQARGADHGWRSRPDHLPDIRVVFCPGSGLDADRSRSRHDGAATPGTAMDAAADPAQRGSTQVTEGARSPRARLDDCHRGRSRKRLSRLRDSDATRRGSAGAILSRTCIAGGRRSQRRQRNPRRLSWFRHDGRDNGAGRGRAHRLRPAPESRGMPRAQREDAAREALTSGDGLPADYLRIPATIGRMLLPVAGIVSVYFLLRGHNAPGGGFVGGLVMATSILVQYMTSGVLWVESRLRVHPQYWVGVGLLAAGIAGISAWLFAKPFLTSIEWDGTLPLLGTLHVSSVLLFDVGVYMVVVGATVLMLIAIAHQSLRRPRKALSADEQEEIPVIATQEAES